MGCKPGEQHLAYTGGELSLLFSFFGSRSFLVVHRVHVLTTLRERRKRVKKMQCSCRKQNGGYGRMNSCFFHIRELKTRPEKRLKVKKTYYHAELSNSQHQCLLSWFHGKKRTAAAMFVHVWVCLCLPLSLHACLRASTYVSLSPHHILHLEQSVTRPTCQVISSLPSHWLTTDLTS